MPNPNTMNRFSTNPVNIDIQRSMFDRNHSVKFSGNVGDLIPFEVCEVLPGDTFTYDTSKVVRMQPLVAPIMDDVFLDTYYFFVPTRLLWNHWKAFWGENEVGPWYPTTEYSVPQVIIPNDGFAVGTIADYMGVPIRQAAGEKISALPFRAYAKICDDWFRDQNLMTPIYLPVDDNNIQGSNGGDQVSDIVKGGKPFIACKYFDYFTSCLPSPQKAPENAVTFNLLGSAPVYPTFIPWTEDERPDDSSPFIIYQKSRLNSYTLDNYAGVSNYNLALSNSSNQAGAARMVSETSSTTLPGVGYPFPTNLQADLSSVSMFNVNELRTAFAIQRYYEKLARGGSRYIEFIKSFFNVDSPDARLQRSEYLGGSRLPLNVSQVEQTSATESGLTPQGNLTGISHTGEKTSDFTKSFTEHGYIIGVCVARYHHTYQDGLDRMWSRKDKFDFYNPTFANLGEQPVMAKEIFFNSSTATSTDVFGYNEAWADYRYCPNRVAGEMRSKAPTPLDMWHLADNYPSRPYLGAAWIREDKTMLDRCLAVTSAVSHQLIFDFYIQARAARPMPMYSIPGLIDHH